MYHDENGNRSTITLDSITGFFSVDCSNTFLLKSKIQLIIAVNCCTSSWKPYLKWLLIADSKCGDTVCPRILVPFHKERCYIKIHKTTWTISLCRPFSSSCLTLVRFVLHISAYGFTKDFRSQN